MKENYCDITFVLDRSGSMSKIKDSTIEGYNKFLKDQKDMPGEDTMTLIQFDNIYEESYICQKINESAYLNSESYQPRSTTALFDAIGKSIVDTGNRLSNMSDDERPEKVVFVILTDGYENASKEYTQDKISEMIKHQTEIYNWKFLFLGANQDAIETASKINIDSKASMTYYANSSSVFQLYNDMSNNFKRYRSGYSKDLSFTEEERKSQEKLKND